MIPPAIGEADTGARVLWVRGERLYLAAPDSGAIRRGDLLAVARGLRTIATARVTEVRDGEFAVASLVSGAVRGERLDRLRVRLRERARQGTLPRLRVGVPGAGRPRAGFACDDGARVAPPAGFVDVDSVSGARRFVRDAAATATTAWPDTLEVIPFADAVDEEIALMRGELDVAVFWPGEPSLRLREGPFWDAATLARPARGVIALWQGVGGAAVGGDWVAPAIVNRERFHGDLETVPAWSVRAAPRVADDPRALAWRYLDVPASLPADSIARAAPPITLPVFAVRCPVIVSPGARAAVEAVGAGRFADLLRCPEPPR